MFLLYADEFGHAGRWDPANPRFCHHPLFGLAGFAINAACWRDVDRGYYRLKRQFYEVEMRRHVAAGQRPERFEAKDLSSRRDRRFTHAVLDLLQRHGATLFAFGRKKVAPQTGHREDALYGAVAQGLMRAFEKFIRHRGGAVAAELFDRGLCLPSGSALTDEERARILAGVRSVPRRK